MKKLLALLLILSLSLSLFACLDSNGTGGNTDDGNTEGGNTEDGNTEDGNTEGGNTEGGNTEGVNTEEGDPNTTPYEFVFVSRGDGTCYIDGVTASKPLAENSEILIPEHSPEGDLVTEIRSLQVVSSLPYAVEESLWNEYVLDPLDRRLAEAETQYGIESLEYESILVASMTLNVWFLCLSDSDPYRAPEHKDVFDLIDREGTRVYVLDFFSEQRITDTECARLQYLLHEYAGVDFSPSSPIYQTVRTLAAEGSQREWAENLRAIDSPFVLQNATTLTLPVSVTTVAPDILAPFYALKTATLSSAALATFEESRLHSLTALTLLDGADLSAFDENVFPALVEITLPANVTGITANSFGWETTLQSIHFGGTVEEWNAFGVTARGAYTVYCSDGEVTYDK